MQPRTLARGVTLLALAALTLACAQQPAGDMADTVYTNGKIYTVNEARPWAEAVAIKDGKFLKVGSNSDVEGLVGDATEVVDLEGRFVMPGVHDTHVHPPIAYVFGEAGDLLFPESSSKQEIQDALRKFAAENQDRAGLKGEKWATSLFPGGKMPKKFLDEVVHDRPVLLFDETGHNATVNSKALEISGITKDTPQPEGGVIDKDQTTGEPTGYLSETAIALVMKIFPLPDMDAYYRGISRALEEMSAYGITSLTDMAVGEGAMKTYVRLEEEGKLGFRVAACIPLGHFAGDIISASDATALLEDRKKYDTHLVNTNNIKYWADGTPMSYTTLLTEPYTNKPETYGEPTIFEGQIDRLPELDREGIAINFHSVGDGTARGLLDILAELRRNNPDNPVRHHIGHLMMVHPDDIPRFKELNVIAEFSPALWYPNALTETAKQYVGEERAARWQPIKEFIEAGAPVSYGSDWPAGTPDADPWRALEGMVTREDPMGAMPGKLGEGIDVATGIRILTMGGAYSMHQDNEVGSIEEGKYADFIVLDRNLLEIAAQEISDTKVLRTYFEGELVYEAQR